MNDRKFDTTVTTIMSNELKLYSDGRKNMQKMASRNCARWHFQIRRSLSCTNSVDGIGFQDEAKEVN